MKIIGEVRGVKVGVGIEINHDEETASLHREATRLMDAGDWDGSIAALYKAQERMRNSSTGFPIEQWVRLPLYLQQAGRFDEAMAEFNRLLDEVEALRGKEFCHHPERFWKGFSFHPKAVIFDKMRLACKRQNLPDQAAKYEALRDEYSAKHRQFQDEFRAWRKEDMEQKRKELEAKYPSLKKKGVVDSSTK